MLQEDLGPGERPLIPSNASSSAPPSELDETHPCPRLEQWFQRVASSSAPVTVLLVSIGIQLLAAAALTNYGFDVKPNSQACPQSCIALVVLLQTLQWLLVLISTVTFYQTFWHASVQTVWHLYFLKIIAFSGLYLLLYSATASHSFNLPTVFGKGDDCHSDNPNDECPLVIIPSGPYELWAMLFYYSAFTQTLVGVGDIGPRTWTAELFSVIQMMVGLVYHVFIISLLVQKATIILPAKEKTGPSGYCKEKLRDFFNTIKRCSCVEKARRVARDYLIAVIIVLQACIYATLATHVTFSPQKEAHWEVPNLYNGLCIFLQFLQIMVIIITSFKYIKHVSDISIWFLVQSYISVILVYAGLYVEESLLSSNAESFTITVNSGEVWEDIPALLGKFLYFSFTLMTACGNPYPILPRRWHAYILCTSQMLLGVFYNVVLLGLALTKIAVKARENLHKIYRIPKRSMSDGESTKRLLEKLDERRNPFLPTMLDENYDLL